MITFQEESYIKLFTKEFMDMYKVHWREVESFDALKIKLSPDWGLYRELGRLSYLILFTVKDDDIYIGYNLYVVTQHPHYSGIKLAENDMLYLKPEFRKGLTGYKFIKYCVEKLKNKVDLIMIGMKLDHSYGKLIERLGFKLQEYKFFLEV